MKNILFFGDSLTAGYGLRNAAAEAYPAIIQQKINAENLQYKVTNAGLSGDTSAGGVNRIDYWLSEPVSVFVLELGINDVIRGVPPQTTLARLQMIIDKVKKKYPSAKILLMGMEIPAFIQAPVATEFRMIFRQLAEVNHIALVPFFLDGVAGIGHLNLPDRLHPSAAGYMIIAEKVWPAIRRLLVDDTES